MGVELETLKSELQTQFTDISALIETSNEEIKARGAETAEVKNSLQELIEASAVTQEQIKELEIKSERMTPTGGEQAKTAGQIFAESDALKNYSGGSSATVDIRNALVTSDGASAGDTIETQRLPGIVSEPEQQLRVRDLIPSIPTTSNAIEYAVELVFTNNADYQAAEGDLKAESAITFDLVTDTIKTIAHWIPISKQVLADSAQLQGHIDMRMRYGLKLKEEQELMLGDGTGTNIAGLVTKATAYAAPAGFVPAGGIGTPNLALEELRAAILQVRLALYPSTGIVLNPIDWAKIETAKDSNNQYLFANAQNSTTARLWGLPVVESDTIPVGDFMVGAFSMGATIYDREQMTMQISDKPNDYMLKNIVAILVEERIGLAVNRPKSFVTGTFG